MTPIWLAGLFAVAPVAASASAAGPLLATGSGRTGAVTSVAFSPDGARVLTGSFKTLNLWDAQSGRELGSWTAHDGWVRSVAFSPDGRSALSGGDDKIVRLWDLRSEELLAVWRGHESPVRAVAFSPDGAKALSGACDKTLKLWDVASGRELATWKGHTWNVNGAAFSPDGKTAVSGSLDMSVKIWDAASGKAIATGLGHSAEVLAVAFSPDGKKVLSGSADNTVRLWDAATAKELAVWAGHHKSVNAVAFSPDGGTAASGSRDSSVKLWDVATGKLLATFKGHIAPVNAVAFSPDGDVLVSGSDDEVIKLWHVPARGLAAAEVPKPTAPAKVTAQVSFLEPSGLGMLHGEDKGTIRVVLKNDGPGAAYALRVVLSCADAPGLSVPHSTQAGTLRAGQSVSKDIPIEASGALASGKARIKIEVKEGNGFDAEPEILEFETRAFAPPKLEVAAIALAGGMVKAGEITQLTVAVKNSGAGAARNAAAALAAADPDIFISGDASAALGDLAPGQSKKAVFQFLVNNRFKGSRLPISVELTESLGKYGGSTALNLALGQAAPAMRVVTVKGKESAAPAAAAIEAPPEDVDTPPETKTRADPEAYAVVVGIEKYRQKGIPPVDFAARDAQAMHDYLTRSMGFDEKNVVLLRNEEAGKTDLEKYLGPWLANRVTPKSKVFIYYAGHGAPNPVSGEGYLIPYDGDPNYTDIAAYPVKLLYDTLAKLPTSKVTVVLDSCFSGQGTRSLIAQGARPLVNAAKNEAGIGSNTVVLTAAGGSQISTYEPDAQHGLLTYYILKGLKGAADTDKNGEITTEKLFAYVKPMVEREAKKQNVLQVPTMSPDPSALEGRAHQVWLRTK